MPFGAGEKSHTPARIPDDGVTAYRLQGPELELARLVEQGRPLAEIVAGGEQVKPGMGLLSQVKRLDRALRQQIDGSVLRVSLSDDGLVEFEGMLGQVAA